MFITRKIKLLLFLFIHFFFGKPHIVSALVFHVTAVNLCNQTDDEIYSRNMNASFEFAI